LKHFKSIRIIVLLFQKKIMKHVIYGFWIVIFPFWASGQQRPLFSQYFFNKYYENPAYGGMARSLQADAVYRDQYTKLTGSPSTVYAGFHLPLYRWFGGGGFQIIRQEAGVMQMVQAAASYNYVTRVAPGFLSFGSRIGVHHIGYNGTKITTPGGNYEGTIQHNDPVLEAVPFRGLGLTWEFGVYLHNPDWEAGINFFELPSHSNRLGLATYTKTSGMVFQGQYRFRYGNYSLIPNALVRTDFWETQGELGVMMEGFENFYGGLAIRGYNKLSVDALIFIIGTNIGSHYKVSYSYDLGLSNLQSVHDGSHEILLSYNLNKAIGAGIPPKVIRNPRHL
jgi:type IX secretion system PorP/SprF family membrane protein